MPVTKYDLAFFANQYFLTYLVTPKHPVTPDVCDRFAYNCYSLIVSIPSDPGAYQKLVTYIFEMADYYGIDIKQANEFLKKVPGIRQIFLQYIKDNYRIETNTEIIKRLANETLSSISNAIASSIWAIIKPFIPLLILGLGVIYATNRVTAKR